MMNVLNAYVMFLCSWILMLCYRLFYASLFLIPFFDWFCWFSSLRSLYISNDVRGSSYILVSNHVLEIVGSSVLKSLMICLVFWSCSFRSFGLLLLSFLFQANILYVIGWLVVIFWKWLFCILRTFVSVAQFGEF